MMYRLAFPAAEAPLHGAGSPPRRPGFHALAISLLALSLWLLTTAHAQAQESLCARVKIDIQQELAFERQAFDARMVIGNSLETLALTDVAINITFEDGDGNSIRATSDPNDLDAAFFIRINSINGISDTRGAGVVQPSSDAEIHWLIIPAPGAAGQLVVGKVYFVGANISYRLGGQAETLEVTPDFITVRPTPLLTLDYFLTRNVYADDAFTTAIEPPEPFSLGLRVTNNGHGPARKVTIDTAQPRIVENEQGLVIDFQIAASSIDDAPTTPSLLLDFGDIDPQASKVGRWVMFTTLSGQFVEFGAEFSHEDELGGALTSLIDATNAHQLLHNVRVDLPGRDTVSDFLTRDGDFLRVFESEGGDSAVTDHSATATLQGNGPLAYTLRIPAETGFVYARVPDPFDGVRPVSVALRSDGKLLPEHNVWTSKIRRQDNSWDYYLNLFDTGGTGEYLITMGSANTGPAAPVMQFIPDRKRVAGQQVSFLIEASDPNGSTPALFASALPAGAGFTDSGNGSGLFDWTPHGGQVGVHKIIFAASDGALETTQSVNITVCPTTDTDCDGMDDAWELSHFGTLDRDGSGDFDGDGISDLDEFLLGSNPTGPDAPGIPTLDSPADGSETLSRRPVLRLINSDSAAGTDISYQFELYADAAFSDQIAELLVDETPDTTAWAYAQDRADLDDNHWYYWRARATDGNAYSEWADGRFFVNTVNDAPIPAAICSPPHDAEVDTATPVLKVINGSDPDGDDLNYRFDVYQDRYLTSPVSGIAGLIPDPVGSTGWQVATELLDDTYYYWQVTIEDEHGSAVSSPVARLFVNTRNTSPGEPPLISPVDLNKVASTEPVLKIGKASDPDDTELSYFIELDTSPGFDSPALIRSSELTAEVETDGWQPGVLTDNTRYYWRARAFDGQIYSQWVNAEFLVDLANDAPPTPTINNPGDAAWVQTPRPVLRINPVIDPEADPLSYQFELFDENLQTPLLSRRQGGIEWPLDQDLNDNSWYNWRVRAIDDSEAASPWSAPHTFFVNDNGFNDPPTVVITEPWRKTRYTVGSDIVIAWTDDDPDSDARIALYYDSDASGYDGTLIAADLSEDAEGLNGNRYTWTVPALADGDYYLYATIDDGENTDGDYLSRAVRIGAGANIRIIPAGIDKTTESGGYTTLKIRLDKRPSAPVSVPIATSAPGEGRVDPTEVTFTRANGQRPRAIPVTGVDDCVLDGDTLYQVTAGPARSSDGRYNGQFAEPWSVTNLDNDTANAGSDGLYVCNFTQVSRRRVNRWFYEFSYSAELNNQRDTPISGAVARVRSSSRRITVVDAEASFGAVAAGGTATSIDTVSFRVPIRVRRGQTFKWSDMQWQVQETPGLEPCPSDHPQARPGRAPSRSKGQAPAACSPNHDNTRRKR